MNKEFTNRDRIKKSSIISYLKKVYLKDNREVSLLNFLGEEVEHRYLLKDNDWVEQGDAIYQVDMKWAQDVLKTLAVYTKEKELVVGALFVVGNHKGQPLVAPLLLIPAEIFSKEYYSVKLSFSRVMINQALLKILDPEMDHTELGHEVTGIFEGNTRITGDAIGKLKVTLERHFRNLYTNHLNKFPDLVSEREVFQFATDEEKGFSILSGAGVGVVRKSGNSIGVLKELEALEMLSEDQMSNLLKEFLGQEPKPVGLNLKGRLLTPVPLNNAQSDVFHAISQYNSTVVVGPPGTGKSYTIAALTTEYIHQGKSVLVVSSNNQAVNVIKDKIENDIGLKDVVIRGGGSSDYKEELKERISDLMSGIGVSEVHPKDVKFLDESIAMLDKSLLKLENAFLKNENLELLWGDWLTSSGNSFLNRIKKFSISMKAKGMIPIWKILNQYESVLEQRERQIRKLISLSFQHDLNETLQNRRQELMKFLTALRENYTSKREGFFDMVDAQMLLKTFPAWLVSVNELSHVLPMRKEMFDLLIIDEGSQVDMTSVLPLIQRAKKMVVVGDPKQLKHMSFVSEEVQNRIGKSLGLPPAVIEAYNYKEKSLLDVVNEKVVYQKQVVFLDEHYRSHPSVISFSNEAFYRNQLRIMTTRPQIVLEQSVFLHHVTGVRNSKGFNKIEADFILDKILDIIEDEKPLKDGKCQSIGVLSLIREQVNFLQKSLYAKVGLHDLQRHKILIGTPHTFQGEERDIMFVSFAIDSNSSPETQEILNKADAFNVAVTRGRNIQHIVTSVTAGELKSSLLKNYLSYVETKNNLLRDAADYQRPIADDFANDVINLLKEWGIKDIHYAYVIAGLEIEIVLVHKHNTYCIDLIGFPGQFEKAFPVERYQMLTRVGVRVFPLPYSLWMLNPDLTKKALRDYLQL